MKEAVDSLEDSVQQQSADAHGEKGTAIAAGRSKADDEGATVQGSKANKPVIFGCFFLFLIWQPEHLELWNH